MVANRPFLLLFFFEMICGPMILKSFTCAPRAGLLDKEALFKVQSHALIMVASW